MSNLATFFFSFAETEKALFAEFLLVTLLLSCCINVLYFVLVCFFFTSHNILSELFIWNKIDWTFYIGYSGYSAGVLRKSILFFIYTIFLPPLQEVLLVPGNKVCWFHTVHIFFSQRPLIITVFRHKEMTWKK